jgi:hypothetical protein
MLWLRPDLAPPARTGAGQSGTGGWRCSCAAARRPSSAPTRSSGCPPPAPRPWARDHTLHAFISHPACLQKLFLWHALNWRPCRGQYSVQKLLELVASQPERLLFIACTQAW